jgi:hypothetical protein
LNHHAIMCQENWGLVKLRLRPLEEAFLGSGYWHIFLLSTIALFWSLDWLDIGVDCLHQVLFSSKFFDFRQKILIFVSMLMQWPIDWHLVQNRKISNFEQNIYFQKQNLFRLKDSALTSVNSCKNVEEWLS